MPEKPTLLATKLTRPQVRPDLVARPRLEVLCQDAAVRRLLLVSAPAGYGKSTLVADWLSRQRRASSGWVSLDEGDNDPTRFWSYVIAALQASQPGVGEQSLALLQTPQPPDATLLLTLLINDLAPLPGPCFLILDDYHTITNQTIHEAMATLLVRLPAALHLILISRADPPLPLARLRASGQLLEIREKDLRFTVEETTVFLQNVIGLSLTVKQLHILVERTEGWIAGLQLAGLAAGASANADDLLREFGGSHRHLVDYLVEEVLAQQPPEIQSFLMQTALLDRFCTPLCQAMLAQEEGEAPIDDGPRVAEIQSRLEHLEQANLFLIPLDQERRWYRYHHLFADLLRFRAAQHLDEGQRRDIHRRAAAWLAREAFWPEAVHHALAAGDLDLAGLIVAEQAAPAIAQGQTATLHAWLAALPTSRIKADPRLGLAQAWVELFSGDAGAAERWLQPVLASEAMSGPLRSQALSVRAALAFARQDWEQTIADTEQALAQLPQGQLPLRTLLTWHMAFAYRLLGNIRRSLEIYHQALEMSVRSGNFLINLSARREVAEMLMGQGKLARAEETLRQLLAEAQANGWMHLAAVAGAHVHLGQIAYEQNRLDVSVVHLQAAVSLPQAQDMGFDAFACALLARAHAARGDRVTSLQAIDQAQHRVMQTTHAQRRTLTLAQIGAFWLAQGDVSQAAAWLPDGRDIGHDLRSEFYAAQQLAHARYQLAAGDRAGAASLVKALLPAAEARGHLQDTVQLLLVQAQMADDEAAQAALQRALALAEPAGLHRTFLDGGPVIGELLSGLRQTPGTRGPYLNRLLQTFSPVANAPANRSLVEPLSARELEVLQLMAQGLSNREIAQRLVFTTATAKKHAEHIYGKLGVNKRLQAITRGRELGLIP